MTEICANVSVIIPCYKCTETIERAVDSIAQQIMKVKEVLLVDDSSNDGTLELLKQLQSRYSKNWIQVISFEKNQGPASARNAGWRMASQPYIAFLDADDAWHPMKIKVQYQWMKDHPDVVLTGHTQTRVQGEQQSYKALKITDPILVKSKNLLLKNEFSTRSVMVKSNIQQRFVDGQYFCEDYLLWLRICLDNQVCYKFDIPLAYVFKNTYGEKGLASNLWKMEEGELYCYTYLLREGLISPVQRLFYSTVSMVKYTKRVFSVALRLNQ